MTVTTEDEQTRPFAGRVVLVTGAGRGIGRAVALALAERGADLVLVARTEGALTEVDDHIQRLGGHAALVPGDLAEPTLIEQIAVAIHARWGRLDGLVANAAVLGRLGPVGHIPPDSFERVFAVNVTANWRLIRCLDPLLRAAPAGRAVFVTCRAPQGVAYWGAYAASKAALEQLALIYKAEVEGITPVRVSVIDPGPVATKLHAEAFPGIDPATLPQPETVTGAFLTALA